MSEYLAAAASAVGGPEDLVQRSAGARAAAQGVSVDEILKAWAGGQSAPVAEAPVAETPMAESPAPSEPAPPAPEPVSQPEAPVAAEQPVVAVPASVVMVVEEEPFEPAALADRIVFPGKLGAVIGAMFGMFLAVAVSPFFLNRAGVAGSEDDLRVVLDVNPLRFVVGAAVVSAVFGAIVARLSAIVPAWFDRGLSVRTSNVTTTSLGAALGAVLGVVGAGVLLALGSPVEPLGGDAETVTQLSVLSTMVIVLIGGALQGAITAVAAQILALPGGLTEAEQEESEVIKHRLVTSYLMPVMVVAGIAALVLPFAYLLVSFHTWAPLLAGVAAGGILAFAGLSASRPGMKITAGEFAVAAAGIGALLLIIALVANATSGGAGHEEGLRAIAGI